jgi:hypothetical protein
MGDITKNAERQSSKTSKNPNIIRMSKCTNDNGTKYVVRFLPNMTDPANSMPEVSSWTFPSLKNEGWNMYRLASVNFGRHDKDPIDAYRWEIWKEYEATKRKDARLYNMFRSFKKRGVWYANVFVVSDPVNPENNGKVKILEFKKTIYDKLNEALTKGDDNIDDDGITSYIGRENIFTPYEGRNFVIFATPKQFPDDKGVMIDGAEFVKSQFTTANKRLTYRSTTSDGVSKEIELTDNECKAVLSQTFDIAAQFAIPAPEDLAELINEHHRNCRHLTDNECDEMVRQVPTTESKPKDKTKVEPQDSPDWDEIPMEQPPVKPAAKKPAAKKAAFDDEEPNILDELDKLK